MSDIKRAGARLHFDVCGSGAPLIALHGFTGTGRDFAPLAASLRRQAMTVMPDLLGHGQSDAPAEPDRYRLEQAVRDVLAVANGLGLGSFDLLGYSMGGRIAMRVALAAPERVHRLVLESASPGIRDPEERRRRQAADEDLARSIERDGLPAFVERWLGQDLFRSLRQVPKRRYEALRQEKLGQRPEGLAASLRGGGAGVDPDVWSALGAIRQRVLLIGGMEDQKYLGILQQMADALPDARLVRVPRVGHTVHLERPRLFADYVGEFLRQP